MTFIDLCIKGEASPEDVDDYIDQWHTNCEDGVSLHAFLGLSWNEYIRFAEDSEILEEIIERRRAQKER